MEIDVKRHGNRRIEIRPLGRLEEATVAELRPTLLDGTYGTECVLLNLGDVESIDSAGMALILLARVEVESLGGRFVIESPREDITRILKGSGMDRFVTLTTLRIDALRALGEEPSPTVEVVHSRHDTRSAAPARTATGTGGGGVHPLPRIS